MSIQDAVYMGNQQEVETVFTTWETMIVTIAPIVGCLIAAFVVYRIIKRSKDKAKQNAQQHKYNKQVKEQIKQQEKIIKQQQKVISKMTPQQRQNAQVFNNDEAMMRRLNNIGDSNYSGDNLAINFDENGKIIKRR